MPLVRVIEKKTIVPTLWELEIATCGSTSILNFEQIRFRLWRAHNSECRFFQGCFGALYLFSFRFAFVLYCKLYVMFMHL